MKADLGVTGALVDRCRATPKIKGKMEVGERGTCRESVASSA